MFCPCAAGLGYRSWTWISRGSVAFWNICGTWMCAVNRLPPSIGEVAASRFILVYDQECNINIGE